MEPTILSLASLDLGELEAFVELMFLAAFADGEVTPAERAAFRGQVVKGTHGKLDDKLVGELLAHVERSVTGKDRDAQLRTIRACLPDARKRRAALGHAALVVLADGELGVDEVTFLETAASALGETVETAQQLLEEARSA